VAAGQGTVALEMLTDVPEIDMLAVPIGGGGLLTGMGTAARAMKPGIGLVGVQAQLFPSMYDKLKHQSLPCGGDTLAEGIAVKEPARLPRRYWKRWSTISCWSTKPRWNPPWPCCSRSRRPWWKGQVQPGSPP
jgi:threonine dehydratase